MLANKSAELDSAPSQVPQKMSESILTQPSLIAASSYFDPIPLPEIVSRADAHVGGASRRSGEIIEGRVRDVMFFDAALEVSEIVADIEDEIVAD